MKIITVSIIGFLVAGCAGNRVYVNEPIIDRKGVDMSRYYADKAECEV